MKSSLKIYTRLVLVSWFKALQRETKGGTDKISSKIVHMYGESMGMEGLFTYKYSKTRLERT